MLIADGFDAALIGVSSNDEAVYDINKIIAILMEQGMSEEEAHEYFSYNIECAYMGESTPIYVYIGGHLDA